MQIVEKDFVMKPISNGDFDLTFYKKVKNKETGEIEVKPLKTAYGCSLSSCIKRIVRYRIGTKFENESIYLLEALKEIIKLEKEIVKVCKELIPENFDTGG